MKKIAAVVAGVALGFVACSEIPDEALRTEFSVDDPVVTVLRLTENTDDITDLTIVCIDGVRYLIMPGIGMTVKFRRASGTYSWKVVPETCNNKKGDKTS